MRINIDWEKFYKGYDKVLTQEAKDKIIEEVDKENAYVDELSIIDLSW